MAWSVAALGSVASGTDATAASTGSYTPTANRLLVADVSSSIGAGTPSVPAASGNGVTWAQAATVTVGVDRLTRFVALSGGSPTAGAFTADWGAETQSSVRISVFAIDGADLSGTALAAIVQSKTGTGTGLTGSVTMDSAPDAGNRCIAGFAHSANQTTTERASWTEIHDLANSSPTRALETQWRSDASEQTGSATWATSTSWQGIVAEVKAAGGTITSKSLAGTVTPVGALARGTSKALAGIVTPAGAARRTTGKATAGTLAPAGTITKNTAKALAGTVTPTGALQRLLVRILALAGSISPTGALTRLVGLQRDGTTAPAGQTTRLIDKQLAGATEPVGGLTKTIAKALVGSISPAGTLTKVASQLRDLVVHVGRPIARWVAGAATDSWHTGRAVYRWITGRAEQ